MVLQSLDHGRVAHTTGFEHTEGLDDHAALLVRFAHHPAFGHSRVLEQRIFDLRCADVVAGRDDHVVGTGLVKKVTITILQKCVPRMVPAVFDIGCLAGVVHVFAPGGADDSEFAHRATRYFHPAVVHHPRRVTWHHLADGTATHFGGCGRNEDVEHLGRANTVQHLDAAGIFPELARGVRQTFASTNAKSQRRHTARGDQRLHEGCHLAVEGGCGVADGRTGIKDQLCHRLRGVGCVREIHRRAGPHREYQHAAQAKGKGQRR